MTNLYLRIWLTVVAALALFALASGWLLDRHLAQERARADQRASEQLVAWVELVQNSLPEASAPALEQARALRDWSERLNLPLALDDDQGRRLAESTSFQALQAGAPGPRRRVVPVRLNDGRTLWLVRLSSRALRRLPPSFGPETQLLPPPRFEIGAAQGLKSQKEVWSDVAAASRLNLPTFPGFPGDNGFQGPPPLPIWAWFGLPHDLPSSLGMLALLAMLFLAVAAGAWPVVRRLTRRLEVLKQGVEQFGAGQLSHRVAVEGRDEVAALADSFNQAAARIESLLRSNQSLLANASHELRSPLARLKMAVTLLVDDSASKQRDKWLREVRTNIAELDALVEEVLLSSRLEAGAPVDLEEPVELLGLLVEEAARVDAQVDGDLLTVRASDRLMRRALRNLLENARRYGGGDVRVTLGKADSGEVEIRVQDSGAGVPESERERIFEPFYRLPGHAEREGGVGLGLALVRQIAQRHGGQVRCEAPVEGGTCFVLSLPAERVVGG